VRELIADNFWWKMTALLLAVLAWFGFSPKQNRQMLLPGTMRPHFTRYLVAHPVTITKNAADAREFKVAPAAVDITLSGDEKVLRALSDSEVRATVEVSKVKENGEAAPISLPIVLFLPPESGIKLERMTPERVQVEQIKELVKAN